MELDKFAAFIRRHHVMTLATVGGRNGSGYCRPWVAHAFYAWLPGENLFVFTTDATTRHGTEMKDNQYVAAGIALETRTVGRIRGLQVEGAVRRPEGAELENARKAYLKRFPYAALAELSLWLLEPAAMKLTDNTLGFGKKLIWEKGASETITPTAPPRL